MPYDVIVLDRDLPVVHGDRVCRAVAGSGPRILRLTAAVSVEDRIDGLELGADDYLPKPFAFAELVARVRAPHGFLQHAPVCIGTDCEQGGDLGEPFFRDEPTEVAGETFELIRRLQDTRASASSQCSVGEGVPHGSADFAGKLASREDWLRLAVGALLARSGNCLRVAVQGAKIQSKLFGSILSAWQLKTSPWRTRSISQPYHVVSGRRWIGYEISAGLGLG